MQFLVTGGAGFIGSHLVERLVREGLGPVIVLDNLHRGRTDNLSSCWDKISFVTGDIRNPPLVEKMMEGCTHVFHLASQSNVMGAVQDPHYTLSSNVAGTFNVLDAARRAQVRRVVFASSREVYGESATLPVSEDAALVPKNIYGVSKVSGELLCRLFSREGLETTVLRFANVYGVRDTARVIPLFVENALANRPITLYGGRQTLDLVWIKPVVDALIHSALGKWVEGPVNIGSGKGVAITELARRVMEVTQSKSRLEFVPARENEVVGFVADITRARGYFPLAFPEDPLEYVEEVVSSFRTALPESDAPL